MHKQHVLMTPGARRRPGYIIIAVLVVIVVLSLAAYRFSDYMMGEFRASSRIQQAAEAKALADSGIHYAAALLSDPNAYSGTLQSNPFDNPDIFHRQTVRTAADGKRQGRFSLVAPDYSAESTGVSSGEPLLRYGVTDESGKLNLNAFYELDTPSSGSGASGSGASNGTTPKQGDVLANALQQLSPNMTADIANAIVDWLDPDENARDGGAESQYYLTLSPPYRCKNGPLNSVEELLFVKGVTPDLLFGTDRNRNGKNDDGGNNAQFDPGLLPYLTVYSRESNLDDSGNARIYLNSSDLKTLLNDLKTKANLSADLATYLVAYRLYQAATPEQLARSNVSSSNALSVILQTSLNAATPPQPKQSITSLYSLIGTGLQLPTPPGIPSAVFKFPLSDVGQIKTQYPDLLNKTTTSKKTIMPGRVNVNTAPQVVLMGIPGFTDIDVQNIIAKRPPLDELATADPVFQSTAWLYTEANVSPKTLAKAENYITARTQTYRIQSVGYYDQAGPMMRVEAVVDTNHGLPRILYYRDLTELGRVFPDLNK